MSEANSYQTQQDFKLATLALFSVEVLCRKIGAEQQTEKLKNLSEADSFNKKAVGFFILPLRSSKVLT